jgi:hypothetical protein
MTNGHYLVTEINGDWVDEIDLAGTLYASTHPPGVAYPSDTNEVSAGIWSPTPRPWAYRAERQPYVVRDVDGRLIDRAEVRRHLRPGRPARLPPA